MENQGALVPATAGEFYVMCYDRDNVLDKLLFELEVFKFRLSDKSLSN